MTSIAAVRVKNKVLIATDSQATRGHEIHPEKIIKTLQTDYNGESVVAFCGALAAQSGARNYMMHWIDLLQELKAKKTFSTNLEKNKANLSFSEYLVAYPGEFLSFLNEYLSAYDPELIKSGLLDSEMMIAGPNGVYNLTTNGCLIPIKDVVCMGSGGSYLNAVLAEKGKKLHGSVKEAKVILKEAFKVVGQLDAFSNNKVQFFEIDIDKKHSNYYKNFFKVTADKTGEDFYREKIENEEEEAVLGGLEILGGEVLNGYFEDEGESEESDAVENPIVQGRGRKLQRVLLHTSAFKR